MALAFAASTLVAQELSPRFYWPAPIGIKVATFGYAYSRGDVLTDRSLPVYGVNSHLNYAYLGYLQTFRLFGRTANVVLEVPYTWGTTKGFLRDLPARRDFSGRADVAATLAINLLGAPAMTLEEFRKLDRYPPKLLGASLRIVAPTGRYERDRLINVGANRWAAKAELGSVFPLSPSWLAEVELGVWWFGDNDEFLGATREQDPLYAVESHLVRRSRRGLWWSLDLNYFTGGRTTVGGELGADLQRNSRVGATVLIPFRRRHAVKLSFSTGIVTESGGDYDQYLASYSRAFR